MNRLFRTIPAALLLFTLPRICPADDTVSTDSVMMFCLVRTDPQSGATQVSAVQPIRLWFSKPVAPGSISEESVRLMQSGAGAEKAIPISLQFEPEKNRISAQPLEPLDSLTSYTLTVAGDLLSSAGENLKQGYWSGAPKTDERGQYVFTFRTAGLSLVHSLSDRPLLEPAREQAQPAPQLGISPMIEKRENGWIVVAPGWVTVSLPAEGLGRFQLNWMEAVGDASPRSRDLAPNSNGKFETSIEVPADKAVHLWGEAVTDTGARIGLSTVVVIAPGKE